VLSDVKGQDEAVRFLRCVVEDRFTDPLLLVGSEGVGRRFSALQAVKEVYCLGERESGCACPGCTQVDKGVHRDLTVLVGSETSPIKIDMIRELIDTAWRAPLIAPRRYILLDGVDHMTMEAANALLKTLEEPPEAARFLLMAESYAHVLSTIRSRCGKVSYRPLPDSFVLSVVSRFEKDDVKASIYARMGEGSVGRSLSYSDAGKLGLRDRVFALLQQALDGEIPGVFSAIDGIGKELPLGLRFTEHLLHDFLMVSTDPSRIINTDLKDEVQRLGGKAKLSVWLKFSDGLRKVVALYHRSTSINLPFHVKALFAETFFVV
jgi:DNA polymerase-3 subunit delta'